MADYTPIPPSRSLVPVTPRNIVPAIPNGVTLPSVAGIPHMGAAGTIIDAEFTEVPAQTLPVPVKTSGSLQSLQAATEGLRALDAVAKSTSIADSFRTIGQSAMEAAGAVSSAAGTMRAALTDLVKPAQDFEKAMSDLSADTGMSQADLDALRAKAQQGSRDGWASPLQGLAAMSQLAGAGFDRDQIINATDSVNTFGRANGMAPVEAATLVGNTVRQFKLDPGDTTRVTDVLTAAAKNSMLGMPAFGEALKAAAPAASAAGMSLEQTSAMVAHLSNQGIAGPDIGLALNGIVSRLTSTLPEATKAALDELKVATRDREGKLLPVTDVMMALDKAMADRNYTGLQRLETMNAIFGAQPGVPGQTNVAVGNKLVEGMAQGGFANVYNPITNSTGQAAQTAGIRNNNLDSSLLQFDNALQNLQITLGSTVIPALTEAVKGLTGFVNALSGFAAENPGLTRFVLTLTAAAAAVLTVIGPIMMLAGGIGLVMTLLAGLSPIVLLIGGGMALLITAAVLFIGYLSEIKAFVQKAASWLGLGDAPPSDAPAGDANNGLESSVLGTLMGVGDALSSVINPIETGISDAWTSTTSFLSFETAPAEQNAGLKAAGNLAGVTNDNTVAGKAAQASQATSAAATSVAPATSAAMIARGFGAAPAGQDAGLTAAGNLAGAINDNTVAGKAAQASQAPPATAATVPAAANVIPFSPFSASVMPAPPLADLPQGSAGGGMRMGGFGGGEPVTVNLSVNITGNTDEDIVRRIELWVRNDGGRLIADAVNRESQLRERTQFMARG